MVNTHSNNFTVGDLVVYVLKNHKRDGFKDWTVNHLIYKISMGIDSYTTLYSVDKSNNIDGIVVGTKDASKKVIFIDGILTTNTGVLKRFVQMFKRLYPNYSLEANRRGKKVVYNTQRFVSKFIK